MSDPSNKKQRSADQRQVVGYLRPCLYVKFEKYIEAHGGSKSEAINDAVRKLVDPMPPQQRIEPK